MRDLLKIFFIVLCLSFITGIESIAQTNSIDKDRRQRLDSIRREQWDNWYISTYPEMN